MSMELTLSLAALAIALWALLLAFRLLKQVRTERARLETVLGDVRSLGSAAMSVGQRLSLAEQGLRHIAKRQDELGLRQEQHDDPDARSYEQASKLLRKGAGVEELMDICGISRGEAELLVMMNRIEGEKTR